MSANDQPRRISPWHDQVTAWNSFLACMQPMSTNVWSGLSAQTLQGRRWQQQSETLQYWIRDLHESFGWSPNCFFFFVLVKEQTKYFCNFFRNFVQCWLFFCFCRAWDTTTSDAALGDNNFFCEGFLLDPSIVAMILVHEILAFSNLVWLSRLSISAILKRLFESRVHANNLIFNEAYEFKFKRS